MKKLMCVAALALSLAVGGRLHADPADWNAFSPDGEKFSIAFPDDPASFSRTNPSALGDVHMTFYSASSDSVVYGLGVLELPDELQAVVNRDPETTLAALAGGMVNGMKATKAKVISQKKIKVDGHRGMDIEASVFGGKGVLRYRAVLTEDRIYVMMVMAPADVDVSGETRAFFRSFQLKGALSDN